MFESWKAFKQEHDKAVGETLYEERIESLPDMKKHWLEPFEVPELSCSSRELWQFFAAVTMDDLSSVRDKFLRSPVTKGDGLDWFLAHKSRYAGTYKAVVMQPARHYPSDRNPSPYGAAADHRKLFPKASYNLPAFLFWIMQCKPQGLWYHFPEETPHGKIVLLNRSEDSQYTECLNYWVPQFYGLTVGKNKEEQVLSALGPLEFFDQDRDYSIISQVWPAYKEEEFLLDRCGIVSFERI